MRHDQQVAPGDAGLHGPQQPLVEHLGQLPGLAPAFLDGLDKLGHVVFQALGVQRVEPDLGPGDGVAHQIFATAEEAHQGFLRPQRHRHLRCLDATGRHQRGELRRLDAQLLPGRLQLLRQLRPLRGSGVGGLQRLLRVEPLEFGKRRPHFCSPGSIDTKVRLGGQHIHQRARLGLLGHLHGQRLVAQLECDPHQPLVHRLLVTGKADLAGLGADGAALAFDQASGLAVQLQRLVELAISFGNAGALDQSLPMDLGVHVQLRGGQQLVEAGAGQFGAAHLGLGLVQHEGSG